MSKKYKVKSKVEQTAFKLDFDPYRLQLAEELRDRYGLHDFSLAEIIYKWETYSDMMCAGWLVDDPESVEQVFGVKLEEITEEV